MRLIVKSLTAKREYSDIGANKSLCEYFMKATLALIYLFSILESKNRYFLA